MSISSSASPRTGMHSLPTELKQLIARVCDEEDRRLRQALGLCEDGTIARPRSLTGATDAMTRLATSALALPRCSVGALFGVSREWSELAAPYSFAVRWCRLHVREEDDADLDSADAQAQPLA